MYTHTWPRHDHMVLHWIENEKNKKKKQNTESFN